MLAVMGLIFYCSHQPGSALLLPPLFGIDKLLHFLAYATLAVSILHAFPGMAAWPCGRWGGFGVVLFCLLYGLGDEFHQSFIPGRMVSIWDLAADGAGGVAGLIGWRRRPPP